MSPPSIPQLFVSHWQLSWPVMAIAVLYAGLYVWAALVVGGGWPVRRTLSFLAGVACVVVALQSGIGGFDRRLLSVHMVQHMLLLLVAPLLLLAGQPVALAIRALPRGGRGAVARAVKRLRPYTQPLACLAVFYAVALLTHLPRFYSATLRDSALHDAEHLAYLVAGLLLWWPVLGVDPASSHRLGALGRLIYVLATMPPMAIVGAYLNRHPTLVYPAYGSPGHALGVSAVADQQQAGAIMWVAGNTIMLTVGLWAIISALVEEERRQRAREAREQPAGGASVGHPAPGAPS